MRIDETAGPHLTLRPMKLVKTLTATLESQF